MGGHPRPPSCPRTAIPKILIESAPSHAAYWATGDIGDRRFEFSKKGIRQTTSKRLLNGSTLRSPIRPPKLPVNQWWWCQ